MSCNGGNQWSYDFSWITFFRDVCGLRLPQHAAFAHYEDAAVYGGWRFMQPQFCLVSERPVRLKTTMRGTVHVSHSEDGPSHLWADGTALWHIDGVRVDEQIVMKPDTQTLEQIEKEANEEVKRLRIERWGGGWIRYLAESGAEIISRELNARDQLPESLYRLRNGQKRAVVVDPSTGRRYALGVPREVNTCEQARSWMSHGLDKYALDRT